jgi:hypothetical protein
MSVNVGRRELIAALGSAAAWRAERRLRAPARTGPASRYRELEEGRPRAFG